MSSVALLPLAAAISQLNPLDGSWDLKAGDVTIFRFVVESRGKNHVTWIRPEHFESDGENFSHLTGRAVRQEARTIHSINGDLELEFQSSEPGSSPISVRLHPAGAGHLQATIEGSGVQAMHLVRSTKSMRVGPWDPTVTYTPTTARATNAEMTRIFDADQADRKSPRIDWTVVGPADRKRRERTEELLDAGALQSGEDYYHAAFVFQHGSTPNDFLKAHILAMVGSWERRCELDRCCHAGSVFADYRSTSGFRDAIPDAQRRARYPGAL
jgi:hypothetical protein